MGVKDLWTLLTPYCEKKPLYELSGKVIAVDLAGWVCEAMTIVEYSIHPRFYLRNLYFRTCHLLLMDVYPIFVLEGQAPELKLDTMSQRNQIQFKGSRPRKTMATDAKKDRKRFNGILGQCQKMLNLMGLICVKGLGEAEATCAYLNIDGVVNGCITQDSDCFAYGARVVYRNFSVTNQGNCGSVDVYNLDTIEESFEFGRNKMVALALLCGCDYNPAGVPGVGRDCAVKLLAEYHENEILDRLRKWRSDPAYFRQLESDINDPNKCTSCGHAGKLQKHSRSGCMSCNMSKGCESSRYKEERLVIKNELQIRQKALQDPNFPNEEIIDEFLHRRDDKFEYTVNWYQPDLAGFVQFTRKMMEWEEIYSVEKLFPILTRWQMLNADLICNNRIAVKHPIVKPLRIKRKRHLKGVHYYEIVWDDADHFYITLIPSAQMNNVKENCTTDNINEVIFTTNEPEKFVEKSYPTLVDDYLEMKNAKKKKPTKRKTEKKTAKKSTEKDLTDMLSELSLEVPKKTRKTTKIAKNQGTVDHFFQKTTNKGTVFDKDDGINNQQSEINDDVLNDYHITERINLASSSGINKNKIQTDIYNKTNKIKTSINPNKIQTDNNTNKIQASLPDWHKPAKYQAKNLRNNCTNGKTHAHEIEIENADLINSISSHAMISKVNSNNNEVKSTNNFNFHKDISFSTRNISDLPISSTPAKYSKYSGSDLLSDLNTDDETIGNLSDVINDIVGTDHNLLNMSNISIIEIDDSDDCNEENIPCNSNINDNIDESIQSLKSLNLEIVDDRLNLREDLESYSHRHLAQKLHENGDKSKQNLQKIFTTIGKKMTQTNNEFLNLNTKANAQLSDQRNSEIPSKVYSTVKQTLTEEALDYNSSLDSEKNDSTEIIESSLAANKDKSVSYFFSNNQYENDIFEQSFNDLCGKSIKTYEIESDTDKEDDLLDVKLNQPVKSEECVLVEDSFEKLINPKSLYERIGYTVKK